MLTRRELLAGAATLSTASRLLASKSHITKAHISAITDEIGLTQADAIAFAHEYGLEWVELRNVPETKKEFTFLTEPELKRWAAELATSKLKVSFLNTSLLKFTWPGLEPPKRRPESDEQRTTRVAHEKQLWENRKEDVTKAVLAANILGCDRIRVFTGERVAQPETTYKMIVQTMEELIPIAEKGKVHLVIENENTQNIGTSAETRDIMQLLPSKTIGFNWDPGNSITLKEVPWPDGYRLLPINRMLNVQFKAKNVMDNNNEPIDWKSIMEAMQKDGYQGRLGLETHMGLGPERIKNAHASMRNILHMVGELS